GQNLIVDLFDPTGAAVFEVGETSDVGPYVLPHSGTYTLNVRGPNNASGNYSFRLMDLSASPTLTLNAPVSATLSNAYQSDFYQFTSTAGQILFYDALTNDINPNSALALLLDPRWQTVGVNTAFQSDRGPFTIQYAGICYLSFRNTRSSAFTYSFRLLDMAS